MQFEKIEIKDSNTISPILRSSNEISCENSFLNLVIWEPMYKNQYAIYENTLFIRSYINDLPFYRLPYGENVNRDIERLSKCENTQKISFWTQEGTMLSRFINEYCGNFVLTESRDAFDYLYERKNLAELSGKKYHSKRNHITAFNKKYNWKYSKLTKENINDVLKCADRWYSQFGELTKSLETEKQGIITILENFDCLDFYGGVLYCDGQVVAFTIGSPISNDVFDIQVEKALKDYQGAYAMINYLFAKNALSGYKYINREDDMGLEGLRKAKLSYYPERLVKKYNCLVGISDKEKCRYIYEEAFGKTENFDNLLFSEYFDYCKCFKVNGNVVSMLFLFPCEIITENGSYDAYYLYAAATDPNFRDRGYMSKLINRVLDNTAATVFLKPANDGLVDFYKKFGFVSKKAIYNNSFTPKIKIKCDMTKLCGNGINNDSEYILMFSKNENFEKYGFCETME